MFLNGSMERNLDENDAAALKRDGAKKRLRFDEGEPDDRRKRSKPHEPKPVFTEYNWNEDGNKEECTMYSLNSTLVNCLDRDPMLGHQFGGVFASEGYNASCAKTGPPRIYCEYRHDSRQRSSLGCCIGCWTLMANG